MSKPNKQPHNKMHLGKRRKFFPSLTTDMSTIARVDAVRLSDFVMAYDKGHRVVGQQ